MIARAWTTAFALPIVMLGVSGISPGASADGAKNCRQYVPGAGVTISVECEQPAAAVVLASAPLNCRRYIPGAGFSIEEACPEEVAPNKPSAVSIAPEAAFSGRPPEKSPLAGGVPVKSTKPEKAERPAVVAVGGKPDRAACSAALDRAVLGSETETDLKTLRSTCSSGS